MTSQEISSKLCAECGFCCNGVIFADVRLQDGDNPAGLPGLKQVRSGPARLPQPCPALQGILCTIYARRPGHCRNFECLLFQKVLADASNLPSAQRTVASSRKLLLRIHKLLATLGDQDDHLPLSRRLQRTARRMERQGDDPILADAYSTLTLAAHQMNTVLQNKFYPG